MVAKKCPACTDTCYLSKSIPPSPRKKCYEKNDKECKTKKSKGYVCVCKNGFNLNKEGKCVKMNECYGKPPTTKKPKTTTLKCSKNECSDDSKEIKPCPLVCNPGACVCKKDYVRDEVTGKCVKRDKCTKTSTPLPPTTPICKENEHFEDCADSCIITCDNYHNPPQICPQDCLVGCVCNRGYIRDRQNKKCVLPEDCPSNTTLKCPKNERFNKCGTACPITCNNYYNQPKECTLQCVAGCECSEGYIRDKLTKKCVLPSNCSPDTKYECPKNAHFEKCSTACPITCSNYNNPPKYCTFQCRAGCACNEGFVYNEKTKQCVRSSECSSGTTVEPETTPVCPKNMVYTKCKSACPPRCGIPANVTSICTKECAGEGCECREPFALDEFENCVRREECKKPSKGGYYIIHMLRKTVTSMYTLIFRH
uniref:Trypsin Inhibitor like cysteine rich domain protein n=1 Tax=Strongyloides venezuelensis TaxID=75913 RepID=A0A0K0FZE5_STRVS